MDLHQRIAGCVLGTAAGDAIGLPREGLSRRRAARLFGLPPMKRALIVGRGLCSDDTEHTLMTAQAFVQSGGEVDAFARRFAWRLRWWLLRLPAGVGLGTLRACMKLWLGFSPSSSGVRSAGNGPAMRSALLGLVARDEQHLRALVKASTRVTHTDPRAEQGAMIIAMAAFIVSHEAQASQDIDHMASRLLPLAEDAQLREHMQAAFDAMRSGATAETFADSLGLSRGVSGFINHTVPVVVFCWLRYRGQFREAVEAAIALGGDSDTTGAIVGALAGAELGDVAIPEAWLTRLVEWPWTVKHMRRLANEAAECAVSGVAMKPTRCSGLAVLMRNLPFVAVVLAHGFRRLLPPY